jgi:hypothetical protein
VKNELFDFVLDSLVKINGICGEEWIAHLKSRVKEEVQGEGQKDVVVRMKCWRERSKSEVVAL